MANVVLDQPLIIAGVWPKQPAYTGITVLGGSGSGSQVEEEPTFFAWVRGTVTKFQQPFALQVVAVSVGTQPKVLGTGWSDPETGVYAIDVAPYTGEVWVLAAQDYGAAFAPNLPLGKGQYVHPTLPNRYVYRAEGDGELAGVEPLWPTEGQFACGQVVLTPVPLYEPLAGGYLKPTIEAK